MPQKLSSTAKLVKDFMMVVDDVRVHSVRLDLPLELGTDKRPTALELPRGKAFRKAKHKNKLQPKNRKLEGFSVG